MSTQTRFYEFYDSKSHKYWEATLRGTNFTVRYDSWGGEGRSKTKTLDSAEAAEREFEKACKKKQAAGYVLGEEGVPTQELTALRKAEITKLKVDYTHPKALALICEIRSLEHLVITRGDAPIEMPESLGEMENLRILQLTNVTRLPDSIGKLKRLSILDCSGLEALPESIDGCTSLDSLWLKRCTFTELPESVGTLPKLRVFEVRDSELVSLPESIGNLPVLGFEIHESPITALPESIGNLPKVKIMELEETALRTFPESFGNLKTLKRLRLDDSPIEAFPESFGNLSALEELSFKGWETAPIAALPDSFRNLHALRSAVFQRCSFRNIPEQLRDLPALEEVDFQLCRVSNVPKDALYDKEKLWEHLGWAGETREEKRGSWEIDLAPASEAERATLAKSRKAGFDAARRTMGIWWNDDAERLTAYALGKTDAFPEFSAKDVEDMFGLQHAFAPYAEWTFVDRRLLALCASHWRAGKASRDTGLQGSVCLWLADEVMRPGAPGRTAEVAKILATLGVSSEEFAIELLHYAAGSMSSDGALTELGTFVAGEVPASGAKLLEESLQGETLPALAEVLFRSEQEASFLGDLFPEGKREVALGVFDVALAVRPKDFVPKLLAFHQATGKTSYLSHNTVAQLLMRHAEQSQRDAARELAVRGLELLQATLNSQGYIFQVDLWRERESLSGYIQWLLETFGPEVTDAIHSFVEGTRSLDLDVVEVCVRYLGQGAMPALLEALKVNAEKAGLTYMQRLLAMLRPYDIQAGYEKLWEHTECPSSEIADAVAALLASRLQEVGDEAVSRLASDDAAKRLGAAMVCGHGKRRPAGLAPDVEQALLAAFAKERDEAVRDAMADVVYATPRELSPLDVDRRIADAKERGRLRKLPKAWLAKAPSLPIAKCESSGEDIAHFLLERQSRIDHYRLHPEARDVIALLDESQAEEVFATLFAQAKKNGGISAKNRSVLSLIGSVLPKSIIPELAQLGKDRNENAIAMLAMGSTMDAAAALDAIRRKFPVKYPNVRSAAERGLEAIASKLGIAPETLRDELLPNIDIRIPPFEVGDETVRVILSPALGLAYEVGGKTTSKAPKGTPAEIKAKLKALAKEVKPAANERIREAESWLAEQRTWDAERWQERFLQNKTGHALAQGLIWRLVENGEPKALFTVHADLTLQSSTGKKLSLLERNWRDNYEVQVGMVQPKPHEKRQTQTDLRIGIAHPIDIPPVFAATVKTRFFKQKIKQPIAQLDRPVVRPSEEEGATRRLYRFEGRVAPGKTFKKRAAERGWRRGSVVDAGEVSGYVAALRAYGIDAHLSLRGLNVRNGDAVTIGALSFVPAGAIEFGSYFYDEPRSDADSRLLAIADVPPVVFSEVVSAVEAITGGGE